MTRRIDRAVIMCLILVNITLIALIAAQGQRIDKALEKVEAIAEQEEPTPEDALLAAAKGQAFNAAAELSDAKEAAKPQEAEKEAYTFIAYAYCACEKCCGEWAEYGKTASGTTPEQGRTVAVDPEVIPLGSSVWIDGEGPYVAEDTGSGIAGDTIDIFFASHQDALNWGKRQVQVVWEEKP